MVRATRVGADTQLAQMTRLVEEAQNGKAPVQRLADRVSGVFVPVVMALAAATLLGFWLLARRRADRRVHRGGRRADHRLPLRAGPGHADRADGRHRPRRAARHPDQGARGPRVHPRGRHRRARQDRHRHHRPDDRSSTWWPRRARTRRRSCALAAALEDASEHPVARAIDGARPRRGGRPAAGRRLRRRAGLGVRGRSSTGRAVVVGRAAACSPSGHRGCPPT